MKKILLVTLCFLLSACGFHLQGEMQLAKPLHRLYLQTTDPYGILARNLQQYLKMSKVIVTKKPEQADTILVILSDSTSQTLLSVSSTQQTRQYNLTATVLFEVTDAHGEVIVTPQALSETRPITIQSNQILGSSNEAGLYYQQMRRQLAYAIMNRIASKEITRIINQSVIKVKAKKP